MRALNIRPLLVVSESLANENLHNSIAFEIPSEIPANHLHKQGQQNKTADQFRVRSKAFHAKLHGNISDERTKQSSQRNIFALVFRRLCRDHQLIESTFLFSTLNYSVVNCLCNIDNASKV